MSRTQQDQVIDDDESETCPLCIEEFDPSDKNFRPCPCGYQICQFCYNNIKTTMNGLCPACRRIYDDKNIQWKRVSAEEMQSHKEAAASQARKKQAAKQKEAAKREADALGRKHLAGIRVRQKNLVYVTGMRPTSSAEHLSEILRSEEYFGQYGKIIKVVVSKAKDTANPLAPVGVYVTFANKDDASKCIAVVDGSQNYDMKLRAQYGTTKYCSAYLRGENCTNRSCMFLHEPGEESESFSRQDLSSMNVISTQSPTQANMSTNQVPQPQPPPQQAPQSIAAATLGTEQHDNRDETASQVDSSDGPALPSTVSWANKNASSGGNSQVPSVASLSPHMTTAVASSQATVVPPQAPRDLQPTRAAGDNTKQTTDQEPPPNRQRAPSDLRAIQQSLATNNVSYRFDMDGLSSQLRQFVNVCPPLFDLNGGAKRHLVRRQESERSIREKDSQVASQALAGMDLDEAAEGGSLQLGGEPEDRQSSVLDPQQHNAIQPPSQDKVSGAMLGFDHVTSPSINASSATNERGLTAQQQQQYLLQQFKSSSPGQAAQSQNQHSATAPGHARHASRYSFANDSSASASVKPVANAKLMSQQSSMMPPSHNGQYNNPSQQSSSQFFSSGIQGPPPGLKATGTPSVSGGGMFGQGHGFATAGLGYGITSAKRNVNDQMMQELLRNRGGSAGSAQAPDSSRYAQHESLPSEVNTAQIPDVARNFSPFNVPSQGQSARSTPLAPPGLLPFSRSRPDYGEASSDGNEGLPLMPGLGIVPSSVTPKRLQTHEPSIKRVETAEQKKEVPTAAPRTNESLKTRSSLSVDLDASAFPALPKPTQVPQQEKKAKPIVKPSAEQSVRPLPARKATAPAAAVVTDAESDKKDTQNKADQHDALSTTKAERQLLDKLDTVAAKAEELSTKTKSRDSNTLQKEDLSTVKPQDPSLTTSSTSQPQTPEEGVGTPAKRVPQPQTLRVVAGSKADPAASASSSPAVTVPAARGRQHSRHPSVASNAVPETPASERASDNVSLATGSVSRPSSPGGSNRIGSAPIRNKTKAALKKERQEKAKASADVTGDQDTSAAQAVVQEPIIGRKKKAKIPAAGATGGPTATSTPGPSRPVSPGLDIRAVSRDIPPPVPEKAAAPIPPVVATEATSKRESMRQPDSSPIPSDEATKKALSAVASVIESLIISHDDTKVELEQLIKLAFHSRHDLTAATLAAQPSLAPLSTEELAVLDAGQPVRRSGLVQAQAGRDQAQASHASRLMLSPLTRTLLRGETLDQEERYLELEARIHANPAIFTYHHHRQHDRPSPEQMLKDNADQLLRPSNTTTQPNIAAAPDPSNTEAKPPMYGDDALQYLDRFILPPAPGSSMPADDNPPPISSAIPRTYTTGDPTYSVSGVDIPSSTPPPHQVSQPSATSPLSRFFDKASAALAGGSEAQKYLGEFPIPTGDNLDTWFSTEKGRAALARAAENMPGGIQTIRSAFEAAGAQQVALVEQARKGLRADEAAGGVGDVEFMERSLLNQRKANENIEKKLAGLVKRNRKLGGY
ncbi:MAG: transcriptional repressor general negative regulator of transcription subunit 4 [Chrysothrix sp. TS-e1954]|nr:MAG: transcriptional repressor general negative regulator of transcription subunit 4 [Chrysothrix sp. TS-e1954]